MSLHQISGRRALGFGLALFTAFMWGILPIALKILLDGMDAYTIIWYRFLTSGGLLAIYLVARHGAPDIAKAKPLLPLFLVAIIGLNGNYLFYMLGLNYITPSAAVVVVQLAPLFFLIGGLFVFKENFTARQYFGFALVVIGLSMFFNQRIGELLSGLGQYTIGVISIFVSALVWAGYAMAQKQLLKHYSSQSIMVVLYLAGAIFFLPVASPGQALRLDGLKTALLVFCALNTLIAYGTFSESLDHLEASRVSAVLAVIPLVTMISMAIVERAAPGFVAPERLNWISLSGGVVVVVGSILASMGSGG